MNEIDSQSATALYDGEFWVEMSHGERARWQIVVDRLCMPFEVFHEAVEKTLGRPVFSHEFGLNYDGLVAELFNNAPSPSLGEIVDMIPEEKRILINLEGS